MGGDLLHWGNTGRFPPLYREADHGEATLATIRWNLEVPPLEEAIQDVGLEELETYIYRIQNTVDQYIATMLKLDL